MINMKSAIKMVGMIAAIVMVAGCSHMGKTGETLSGVGSNIGSGITNAVSSLDYETGIHVPDEKMKTFVKGRTTKQNVIDNVGHPPSKNNVSGKEVWRYTYTKLPAWPLGKTIHEDTIFEFSGNVLHQAYKTSGTRGESGNAMLDAAGL